jgi:hypothetical protein
MQAQNGTVIRVQREWDGWRSAQVRTSDLEDVHWLQPGRAPRPLVHGYISCADIVDGDLPHDCGLTHGPHRLLVCVVKRHVAPCVYAQLMQRADEARLASRSGLAVPASALSTLFQGERRLRHI